MEVEDMKPPPTPRSRAAALTIVLAALYATAKLIYLSAIIGVGGRFFTAADALAPLYGILFGPYVGTTSVIVGSLIGISLTGQTLFLGLDFLPAAVNTLTTALLMMKKRASAAIIFTALLLAFSLNPNTSLFIPIPNSTVSIPYVWMHLIALAVLISPLPSRGADAVKRASGKTLPLYVAVISFIGTMAQHLMGNMLFETILGSIQGYVPTGGWPLLWQTTFWVYPLERLLITAIASAIGSPLTRALKNTKLQSWAPSAPP
jgi:hypothetical protein